MTYIKDPVEIMEDRMERQISLIDEFGRYPCVYCGELGNAEDMHTVSEDPSSPLMCDKCASGIWE